jgi:cardiolipin synthase
MTIAPSPISQEETPSLEVAGQHLTVFAESPPLLDAMAADMAAATKRIWLETYIFFNDAGGKRIAEILKSKAREGLDVRVLYDAVGSISTPSSFFRDMEAAGVRVRAYRTLWDGLRRFRFLSFLNHRNHRKLLVIDDRLGFFGGMNIVDNVDPASKDAASKPTSSGWRDVHVRLEGSQQPELGESFLRVWNGIDGPRRGRAKRRRARERNFVSTVDDAPSERICFIDSTGKRFSRAFRVYTRLINRSRRQITLAMAYFIPTGAVLRALLRARKRRVGIRIILPDKSDVPLAQRAANYLYRALLRRGFRIYQRRSRMLHSKVMIVDDLYTVVGSANLDPRSLHTNLEFLAVIRSQSFARLLSRIARDEIAHSNRITAANCRPNRWQLFLNTCAWWLRWAL